MAAQMRVMNAGTFRNSSSLSLLRPSIKPAHTSDQSVKIQAACHNSEEQHRTLRVAPPAYRPAHPRRPDVRNEERNLRRLQDSKVDPWHCDDAVTTTHVFSFWRLQTDGASIHDDLPFANSQRRNPSPLFFSLSRSGAVRTLPEIAGRLHCWARP
jgi:hypothetical protein